MNSNSRRTLAFRRVAVLAAVFSTAAVAAEPLYPEGTPIARVRMTDNDLTCAQLYAESNELEKIVATSKDSQNSSQNAVVAAGAASQVAPVASAFGGMVPFGGMFGQVAGRAAAQVASNSAQNAAERTQQASARKEIVVSMFLNKQCKVSELQQTAAAPAAGMTASSVPPAIAKP